MMFDEAEAAWCAYAAEHKVSKGSAGILKEMFLSGWNARHAFEEKALAAAAARRSAEAQQAIREVRESYKQMRIYCLGCTVMKREGASSYEARVPVSKQTGHCLRCGKPWAPKDLGT